MKICNIPIHTEKYKLYTNNNLFQKFIYLQIY